MKKPSIPAIGALPPDVAAILKPLKANLDYITGRSTGELDALPATATTAQIIAAINALNARLNAST